MNHLHTHALRQGNAPPDLLRHSLPIARQMCGVATLPIEMLLYPSFGTRYFTPIVVPLSFAALYVSIYLPEVIAIRHPSNSAIPELLLKAFYIGFLIHFVRIARRMIRPETEEDSEWEGTPLPFFRLIPFGGNWAIRRIIYEPAIMFVLSGAFLLNSYDPAFSNYLLFASFGLFAKASLTWYESWTAYRDYLDKASRAELISSLTDYSGSVGRFPLSPLANAPENQRSGLVAAVAPD